MPVYYFWGEDEFALSTAVEKLYKQVLDPNWVQFNYHKLSGDQAETLIEALNLVMTPVFGAGGRLVWLENTTITQNCADTTLQELQRTQLAMPDHCHLLLTSKNKPDSRLKSTKFLKKIARIEEFVLIPPWQTEEIADRVRQLSQQFRVSLTAQAIELLVDSVGNDSRKMWQELEKLSIYAGNPPRMLEKSDVALLVLSSNQNSLQLANAILHGDRSKALGLVTDLFERNEPALKIIATVIGQFRTWTLLKLMLDRGEKDDQTIASIAEIGNPKRIYFLKKEVLGISSQRLLATLSILLELEFNLKRGGEPLPTLQTKIVELCSVCEKN
jgi:DNA polymerase III subunit delta